MKKCKKIILLALVVILSMSLNVYAEGSTGDVTIKSTATTVKAGDTITATITAKWDKQIGSMVAMLNYDTTKLELKSKETHTSYVDMGTTNEDGTVEFSLLYNKSEDAPTECDLMILQFKVLNTVTVDEELKVSISEIQIEDFESDATYNKESSELTLKVGTAITPPSGNDEEPGDSAKITEINITNPPTKTTYKVGEKFDPTGIKVVAVYDDGTKKEITDFTYSPDGELKETDTIVFIKYYSGGTYFAESQSITVEPATQEDSSSQENPKDEQKPSLPYAGIEDNIPMLIIATIIISIGLYIKCKKYKDVI